MGCVGSRSPAGQGKSQRPGTGWGVGLRVRRLRVGGGPEEGGRGRCRKGGACTGRRARPEERAGWSGEGAKMTGARSCGLPASGLCRVDSCLSTCIPTAEGDRRRLAQKRANRPSPPHGDWLCPPTYSHPALPAPLLAALGVSLDWESAFPSCVPTPLSLQLLAKYPTKEFLIKSYSPLQRQMDSGLTLGTCEQLITSHNSFSSLPPLSTTKNHPTLWRETGAQREAGHQVFLQLLALAWALVPMDGACWGLVLVLCI